jgi:hypothetical protein
MNWCQLFGCYFPADRRFSLGLPDHPSDCSSPFMVLSPLAFPPWRCARRCTRIVPCELAMALADRVLLASDVLARIALRLRGTFGASVLMRTLLWSVSAVLYPVFCSVTASGHLRRPAALGLLLRILRPSGSRFLPKQVCKAKNAMQTSFGPLRESRHSTLGAGPTRSAPPGVTRSTTGKSNKRRHHHVPEQSNPHRFRWRHPRSAH